MFKMINKYLLLSYILLSINAAFAWDSEQLEVFDVVEEVKQNFYELLNITQDATNQEIKSSFRSLSLKLHPDKNLDTDTSEQFRNLVAVYEILRNVNKRRYYDEVLTNGLPNWRSAVYYYRHVRKMGLTEICFILMVIISIGQYLVGWASYAEQKYTLEQKKKKRYKKTDKDFIEIEIPKPSLLDTLPIQIPRFLWWMILELPHTLLLLKQLVTEAIKKTTVSEPKVEKEVKVAKPMRKRKPAFVPPEGSTIENNTAIHVNTPVIVSQPAPVSGGLWTDDDLDELVQLVKKYPGGTPGRWEIIAEALNRSVPEVTYMANKLKSSLKSQPEDECQEEAPRVKQKTRAVKIDAPETEMKKWSQTQQKALEDALLKFPKGCTDRWDRIAECVPEKTKEECIMRFRHLAEVLRKQKDNQPQTEISSEQ